MYGQQDRVPQREAGQADSSQRYTLSLSSDGGKSNNGLHPRFGQEIVANPDPVEKPRLFSGPGRFDNIRQRGPVEQHRPGGKAKSKLRSHRL